jgi:methylenetetrahydrofolate--tRNA-(uracil-5-)-methyltransferase
VTTAFGALLHHVTRPRATGERFEPSNINFGLLPPLEVRAKKAERRRLAVERATRDFSTWLSAA